MRGDVSSSDGALPDSEHAPLLGTRGASANLRQRRLPNAAGKTFESLDYDVLESEVFLDEAATRSEKDHLKLEGARWLICLLVGIITGAIATAIDLCIRYLSDLKFLALGKSMDKCTAGDCLWETLLIWVAINVGYTSIGGILGTLVEPLAAGSGIPEIKCYLNGIKIPHVVRIKTLLAKAVGVLFSVSGGLAVGKEGPMIHSGAVVAAGVSQGKATSFKLDLKWFRAFRNDQEKRDFVSAGAAAGVSAAFGAPIGGVLFALEEGASFWNQALTWRIFFASMTATFTLNVLRSTYLTGFGSLSSPGLLNFGSFALATYNLEELPIFMIMGVIGGLIGALFNMINTRLTILRRHHFSKPSYRLMEVLAISIFTATISFALVYGVNDCLPQGHAPSGHQFLLFCPQQQYNQMASLLFNTPEESIKSLFHAQPGDYHMDLLAIFFVIYFCLSVVTYGIGVPSGLFVPSLLTGAAFGRLFGEVLFYFLPDYTWVDPGKYALIGAAAVLAGIVRMTISLTVIIMEATGNVAYGLPLMLTIVVSKVIGDLFNEGIYDIHIHLARIPLLPWEAPFHMQNFRVGDVMAKHVECLQQLETVGSVYRTLLRSSHHAFPVVSHDFEGVDQDHSYGTFCGIIMRSQLITLLNHRAHGVAINTGNSVTVQAKRLTLEDFQADYPRYPKIESVHVNESDSDFVIDLRPYLNATPYTLRERSALSRAFRLFRGMGLRHLVVVNRFNQVRGMVTRFDLTKFRIVKRQTRGAHTEWALERTETGDSTINH